MLANVSPSGRLGGHGAGRDRHEVFRPGTPGHSTLRSGVYSAPGQPRGAGTKGDAVRRCDVAITGTDEMDLRELVTVFVTTVGYPTFERCLEHLRAQDSRFTLRIIDRVAPMSAAFQRMLDECTTPYYVQVDEDMLLYPHAVRTLYERLAAMESRKIQYVAALYDVHLNRIIYGLKIFRHTVVRRYPFRDVAGCEWDQIRRLRADGYVDVRIPLEGVTR